MNQIKELLKAVKPSDEIRIVFKNKVGVVELTEQDRRHIRIMAHIELAHDRELMTYILNHAFTESIKLDNKTGEVIYSLKFQKERRTKYRGDC